MTLFAQIAGFMLAALALGVGVGWLTWRAGRATVPEQDWRRQCQRLAQLEEQLVALQAELQRVAEDRNRSSDAWHAARSAHATLRAEYGELQQRMQLVEREALEARHERDRAIERAGALQHRLAELSVARARTSGVPQGAYLRADRVLPPSPPADARDGSGPARCAPPTSDDDEGSGLFDVAAAPVERAAQG